MWTDFASAFLTIVLTFFQNFCYADLTSQLTGCSSESSCLKCGPSGCIKCPALILYPSRKCVDSCPSGYAAKWSKEIDYMGRICVKTSFYMGLTAEGASVLTGIVCGLMLCSVVVIAAVIYVRYKRKKLSQSTDENSDVDDSRERKDFLKQLEILKPNADAFLEMLNDTRKQMRELHRDGDDAAASVYKPVIRDLAKVLFLINKPAEVVVAPFDWEHLYNWAEQVIGRYKRMSDGSQTQVGQLVKFLQAPVEYNRWSADTNVSTVMSTFKPTQPFGSSLSLQENRSLNVNADFQFETPLNPQWQFNYPLISNNQLSSSEFTPSQLKQSKEHLSNFYFPEDDFLQLGFRPQDEITTEL